MEALIPYFAVILGGYFAYKLTQIYIRRFGAVWYQGYIIGLPAVFVGSMPVNGFDQTPEWLSSFTFMVMIAVVIFAYDQTKKELLAKQGPEQSSNA